MTALIISRPTRGEGRFIKQSGPIGRFGHVILVVEPTEGPTIELSWQVPEASIPEEFRPSVLQGITGLFKPGGKYASFEPKGLLVRVVGGTYHPTDSNELSYTLAASAAFINAVNACASAAGA
jgi:elongation factor G